MYLVSEILGFSNHLEQMPSHKNPYDQTSVIVNLTPSVAGVNGLVLFPGQGDRKSGLDLYLSPRLLGARRPSGCPTEQGAVPQSCNHGLPSDEAMLIKGSGQDRAERGKLKSPL